jgi:hypothetical protein
MARDNHCRLVEHHPIAKNAYICKEPMFFPDHCCFLHVGLLHARCVFHEARTGSRAIIVSIFAAN